MPRSVRRKSGCSGARCSGREAGSAARDLSGRHQREFLRQRSNPARGVRNLADIWMELTTRKVFGTTTHRAANLLQGPLRPVLPTRPARGHRREPSVLPDRGRAYSGRRRDDAPADWYRGPAPQRIRRRDPAGLSRHPRGVPACAAQSHVRADPTWDARRRRRALHGSGRDGARAEAEARLGARCRLGGEATRSYHPAAWIRWPPGLRWRWPRRPARPRRPEHDTHVRVINLPMVPAAALGDELQPGRPSTTRPGRGGEVLASVL